MRRVLLCALVTALAASVGFCQQRADTPDAPVPGDGASKVSAPAPRAWAHEMNELKAAIAELEAKMQFESGAMEFEVNPRQPAPFFSLFATPADSPSSRSDVQDPGSAMESKSASRWPMTARWKDGFLAESDDGQFRVHVGGNLHFDSGWNAAGQALQFGPGGTGELQDGAYFRRATLRVDGTLYQHFEWVAEFDFANNVDNDTAAAQTVLGSPSFQNVWVAVNDVPWIGTVRLGWMDEPVGFEHLVSSRTLNFMERPPGFGALSLRSPGVLIRNAAVDKRVTWAVGFYHSNDDNFGFGVGDGQYAETGRFTWLPWYEDDGSRLLHLGVGGTHRHLNNNEIDLRGRPTVRTMPGVLEPPLAETGTILGSTLDGVDGELAGVWGPWTLQSEYYGAFIHDAFYPNQAPPVGLPRGTLFYQGAYVALLYFLTGEHQIYDRDNALFGRVIPLRNFSFGDGGWGAWQVGLRYSYLDLQNKGINGATLHDIDLGVNWFLNPNLSVQWNFAVDHREPTPSGSAGWTYIFGTRLALDF